MTLAELAVVVMSSACAVRAQPDRGNWTVLG